MLKFKKAISSLMAVVMIAALCAVSPVMAAETGKAMVMDFTDTTAETLPMTNSGANAGGKIAKNTEVHYGNAKQSGEWYVSGTSSSLNAYEVNNSSTFAAYNAFVIRFYSEESADKFVVLINNTNRNGSKYYSKIVEVTKSGWQEVVIPVSDIVRGINYSDITYVKDIVLSKGWGSTKGNFSTTNHLYFDSMFFENRIVVDADNTALTLTGGSNKNKVSTVTTTKYSESKKSIQWYNTAAGNSANSVGLSTIGLDTPEYTKLNLRMYSDAADAVNILLYYTNTKGTAGKYVREKYVFSEAAGNIGKWVEVTLDLTCIDSGDVNVLKDAQILEKVALNRGSWDADPDKYTTDVSVYNNNVYIDAVWFSDPVEPTPAPEVTADAVAVDASEYSDSDVNSVWTAELTNDTGVALTTIEASATDAEKTVSDSVETTIADGSTVTVAILINKAVEALSDVIVTLK